MKKATLKALAAFKEQWDQLSGPFQQFGDEVQEFAADLRGELDELSDKKRESEEGQKLEALCEALDEFTNIFNDIDQPFPEVPE